jgi:hypothetical protein
MLTEVYTSSKSECYNYSKKLICKSINFGFSLQRKFYDISPVDSAITLLTLLPYMQLFHFLEPYLYVGEIFIICLIMVIVASTI